VARYHFITELRVSADVNRVWDVIANPQGWPSWWRWLKSVDVLDAGDAQGCSARHRYTFGTALPYGLSFESETVHIDRPWAMEGRASGDLQGSGLWQLTESVDGSTAVTYTWLVETTKRWMNILAPIGRPAFSWNHDVLMRDFGKGLAAATAGELLAINNTAIRPGADGFSRCLARPADRRPELDPEGRYPTRLVQTPT
jgi:uncharacterized protein YndB with AHSA1/START domain